MKRSLVLITASTCLAGFACGFQAPSSPCHVFLSIGNSVRRYDERRDLSQKKAPAPGRTHLLHYYSLLNVVDDFFANSPYTAAALVCGVKASAADAVAQFQEWKDTLLDKGDDDNDAAADSEEEESSAADLKRNAAFVTYGALYQGLTQEFIYNHLYPVWFGTGAEWTVVLSKVAFSLLVQTTLLTLPSLYLIKAVIERTNFKDAFEKYIGDIKNQGLLQKFYLLWGPVLTLTFSVIPVQWRVTFIAVVSFFWLIILSGISSGISAAEKDNLCAVGQDFCEFEYKSK